MENKQPVEKVVRNPSGDLEVFSIFKTIQGEGPLVGTPAVFVRLAGCVLCCPGCDTDYTSRREVMTPDAIYAEVMRRCEGDRVDLVVITGGEPFRQDIRPLIKTLLGQCFRVQIETNGVICLPELPWGDADFSVVCSPKSSVLAPEIANRYHCLLDRTDVYWKYVLRAGEVEADGLPSRTLLGARPARPTSLSRSRWSTNVFVQPLDEKDPVANARNVKAAVESCMKHGYRLSLQLHKMIGLE